MDFAAVPPALATILAALPATLKVEVSTGLVVLALAAAWLWRGRRP
jgi:hypothetical protein